MSLFKRVTAVLLAMVVLVACQTHQQNTAQQKEHHEQASPVEQEIPAKQALAEESVGESADKPVQKTAGDSESSSKSIISEAKAAETKSEPVDNTLRVVSLCKEVGNKLGSVSVADCLGQNFAETGVYSKENRTIVYQRYLPVEGKQPKGKVLVVGGIHGDEYSSVSIVFKWLKTLNEHHSGLFNWYVMPLLNPDGLLQQKAQRQNANGVDLNRNFPTPNWGVEASKYWKKTGNNVRRYPGPSAASEVETKLLMETIEAFQPDVIVSVHAPHNLVDYDGPPKAPEQLGSLNLRRLGVYPGSLGNYAGVNKDIQVITIELASAGIMPSEQEMDKIWTDLIIYLQNNAAFQKQQAAAVN